MPTVPGFGKLFFLSKILKQSLNNLGYGGCAIKAAWLHGCRAAWPQGCFVRRVRAYRRVRSGYTVLVAVQSQRREPSGIEHGLPLICSTSNLQDCEHLVSDEAPCWDIEHGLPLICSTPTIHSCEHLVSDVGPSGIERRGCPNSAAHQPFIVGSVRSATWGLRALSAGAAFCSTSARWSWG